MKHRKPPEPVTIRWRDAYVGPTWMHEDEALPPAVIVTSVGFRMKGRKGYHVLADSWFDGPDGRYWGGVQCIPSAMVIDE